jgi:hypothetical protein
MSDLAPRPSRPPRRVREQRAYWLIVTGGVAAATAVVGFLLAIIGVIGAGLGFIAAAVAVICAILFRSTVR